MSRAKREVGFFKACRHYDEAEARLIAVELVSKAFKEAA
jgi:hypothetical protein